MPSDPNSYTGFPNKNIPDKDKGEDWHKDYILSILHETMSGGWASLTSWNINENYNTFQGLEAGREYDFIQTAEDGKELPAIWIDYNTIRSKIKVMTGELLSKGFVIEVESINADARTKKMEIKSQMLSKMTLSRLHELAMGQAELPVDTFVDFEAMGFIPNSLEELETYMTSKYKDNTEIVMETALKYNIELYNWRYKRLHAFRDVMIGGRCFMKNEIRDGYPQMRILDPRRVVFDPHATDDFLTDATYWGHARYMPFEDAIEQYNLTMTEIKKLEEKYRSAEDYYGWMGASVTTGWETFGPFSYESGQGNTGSRIMVFEAEWYDKKKIRYKETEDKYGNKHTHILGDNVKVKKSEKKDIKEKYIITIRQGTLIGGYIMKDWGIAKNQPRSIDNPATTRFSLVSLLPDYLQFRTVSKVDEMAGLHKLKNILMYKIQLEVNTAGKKAFFYDVALLPEGFELQDVMYYLKSSGIGVFDSRKEGIPVQGAPIVNSDGSLGNNIGQYLEVAVFVERQMDLITGISEARQGAAASSALVGVTETNIFQSNMATEQYFSQFRDWESRVFQAHADLIKIAWAQNREKFTPVLGDIGFDFLALDQDVDLNDYAIFAKSKPALFEDKNLLNTLTQQALQSGVIDFRDALIILSEDDPKVGMRKFMAIQDRKEAAAAEAQKGLALQQEAAQAAADESEMQKIGFKERLITDRSLQDRLLKNDQEEKRADSKERTADKQLQASMFKAALDQEDDS